MKLYTYSAVKECMDKLVSDYGYEIYEIEEGGLVQGFTICVPPTKDMYYYVIREQYINEWTSGQKVQRKMKLNKEEQKALDKAMYGDSEGVERLAKELGRLLLPPVGYTGN